MDSRGKRNSGRSCQCIDCRGRERKETFKCDRRCFCEGSNVSQVCYNRGRGFCSLECENLSKDVIEYAHDLI
jgi:hypothetical protein